MDILSLRINNFLAIGSAKELRLKDKGLVLIQGVNADDSSATSNGVGKSSIADALCWCLYGETARGVSGDAVVNKVVKKNTSVSITLEDGKSEYVITRYRKHSEGRNSTIVQAVNNLTLALEDISKATEKETQSMIVEIMGCSHDVFMAAIYAGQEVTPDLPKMADRQLKILIEEASGVERLEKAFELSKLKVTELKVKLATVVSRLSIESDSLLDLEKKRGQIEDLFEEFEAGRPEAAKKFSDSLEDISFEITKIANAVRELNVPKIKRSLDDVNKRLDEYETLSIKLGDLKDIAVSKKSECDKVGLKLSGLIAEAQGWKKSSENAEESLKIPCSECGKPHTADELKDHKAHCLSFFDSAMKKVKEEKAVFERIVKEWNDAKEEALEFAIKVPSIADLLSEQRGYSEKIKYANVEMDKIRVFKTDYDSAKRMSIEVMTSENPHSRMRDSWVEMLKKAEVEVAKTKVDLLFVESELGLAESVSKVFSPSGVRAHILDTVTPFLNDRTGDYLSTLSDGNISAVWTTLTRKKDGDLKEKFNIEVSNDKGAESFSGLSGGEKRKVRLATMLALQDLVASRATKPVSIFIADEVDDALDSAGLERLMTILEKKARERGTLLVISHNDLKSWISDVSTVTKLEGISTIDGALL